MTKYYVDEAGRRYTDNTYEACRVYQACEFVKGREPFKSVYRHGFTALFFPCAWIWLPAYHANAKAGDRQFLLRAWKPPRLVYTRTICPARYTDSLYAQHKNIGCIFSRNWKHRRGGKVMCGKSNCRKCGCDLEQYINGEHLLIKCCPQCGKQLLVKQREALYRKTTIPERWGAVMVDFHY